MVTKQQQLEWLANKYKTWRGQGAEYLCLSTTELGKFAVVNSHVITRKEWQQERDKMSSKPEVDSSWYERGELPPVGNVIEAWFDDGKECWHMADVVGYNKHENGVIAVSLIGKHERKLVWVHHFRPLRTEREKAIEEIASYFCDADGCQVTPCVADIISARLYDAGYRKVKP